MSYEQTILKGTTSKIIEVVLRDSTTGAGKTGVAHGDVTASYVREGSTRTAITLVAGTAADAYSSGKWCEVDATNCAGLYQLHIPNAALASGVDAVTITLASTGVIDKVVRISLLDVDLRDATDAGLSNLDAAVSSLATAASIAALNDPSSADIADAVWDEALTGATHNIPTSAGRRLREVAEVGLYEGASVWIDTVNGSAGTDDYENGTVNNPSDNIADATTIANSVGLSRFRIAPASSFTLASGYTGFSFIGDGLWTLALGGQALTNTMIVNAEVSGTCTSADEPMFDCCGIGTVTLPACFVRNSRLESDITLSGAGTYHFEGCMSAVAGTGSPSIDFGSAVGSTNVNFRHYSGGIEVRNMGQSGTDNMSLEGDGALTINANCTGGTIALRGNFKVTDNSGGAVTVVRDDDSSNLVSIKSTTDQFVFTVSGQVDANALTGGGGDDAATIYSYFTASDREDQFKADISSLATSSEISALNNISVDDIWDEAQSGHATNGTFGYYLDAQVSSAGAGGSGLYQVTVTVQNQDGDALQGARVNVDGTTLTLATDSSGQCVFNLDSGVYTLHVSPAAGYQTPTGNVITVATSDISSTFTLEATAPSGDCDVPWVG